VRLLTIATWLAGLGLLAFLLARSDGGAVLAAVGRLRFWLAAVVFLHLPPLLIDAVAWRCVFPGARPSLGRLFVIRWISESANSLLPIPQLGELVRVKLAGDAGADPVDAGASVMIDLTLGIATQALFTGIGLALIDLEHDDGIVARAGLAMIALAVIAGGFFMAQRSGLLTRTAGLLYRMGGPTRLLLSAAGARRLDETLRRMYRDRSAVAAGMAWRLVGWFAGAAEVWLALLALGHPVSIADALTIEALSQAVRAAAFIVPGGLGVQDGALMLMAAQMGFGAEAGLALSLVKRCREIVLGVPGLALAGAIEMRGSTKQRIGAKP
jgi:glycosyltransferase 2 family protein